MYISLIFGLQAYKKMMISPFKWQLVTTLKKTIFWKQEMQRQEQVVAFYIFRLVLQQDKQTGITSKKTQLQYLISRDVLTKKFLNLPSAVVESLLVIPAELCREFRRDVGEKMFMGAKMFNNVQNIQFTIVLEKGYIFPSRK